MRGPRILTSSRSPPALQSLQRRHVIPSRRGRMLVRDVLVVVLTAALFGLMAVLARLCDSVHTK